MFNLDLRSKKSIHEQIVDGIKNMIIHGEYQVDEKLPSVRDLSAILTVNPNTIAKAFKSLETQGWIYTVSGRGCFVSSIKQTADVTAASRLYASIEASIKELVFMGISKEDIFAKINELLEKGGALK